MPDFIMINSTIKITKDEYNRIDSCVQFHCSTTNYDVKKKKVNDSISLFHLSSAVLYSFYAHQRIHAASEVYHRIWNRFHSNDDHENTIGFQCSVQSSPSRVLDVRKGMNDELEEQ